MTETKAPWSVWLAYVMHTDGAGKERPVVVLNDGSVLCVCLAVTSKRKNTRYGYKLKSLSGPKLAKESWVAFGSIELSPNAFRRQLGMLDECDIIGIQAWLKFYPGGSFIE